MPQRDELERFMALENAAGDWHRAKVLSEYVAALEQRAHDELNKEKRLALFNKVEWAKEKVAWLDPLISRIDLILGRRYHTLPEEEKVDLEQVPQNYWEPALDEEEFDEDEDDWF